jgi:hypothetical protein
MAKTVAVSPEVKQKLSHWYDTDLLDSVSVLKGSIPGRIFGTFGQHAVTINGKVHLTSSADDLESDKGTVLLGHECFHVVQQQQMGWWGFLIKYIAAWRPSHIKHGSRHPLEAPAYERGREILSAIRQD